MLDMMQKMGPFMEPLFWTGVTCLVLGVLFFLGRYMSINTGKTANWFGRIVIALGVFFVVAHFMGTYLGMDTPYIGFGDVVTFDIMKGYFWVLGTGFLVAAVILKLLLNLKSKFAA